MITLAIMNRVFQRVLRNSVKFLASWDKALPAILEQDLAGVQGKGVGSESVLKEALVVLKFFDTHIQGKLKSGLTKQNRDLVVFDIGANNGDYSAAILKLNPKSIIYAFEPSFTSGLAFKARFNEAKNVKFFNLAISNEIGVKTLFSEYPGSPLSSLVKRNLEHFGKSFEHQELVQTTTLDNFCELNCVIPDVLKMDVEGYELNVLLGGLEVIKKISVIQFEFGGCNIDTRTFFQDFWYFFHEYNFTIYRITKNESIVVSNYTEADEYFSTTNYVAINNNHLV